MLKNLQKGVMLCLSMEIRLREPTLSMKEWGRRVLQIFQKIFRGTGDHRPKYFMAQ